MTNTRGLPERDAAAIAGNQKLRFFPLSVVSARGAYVTDHTGRQLLDMSAAWGANSLGHAHPSVVAAIRNAAENGGGASVLSAMQPAAVELAEKLLTLVPSTLSEGRRVLFGHSGTDANNAALAAARTQNGRTSLLAFRGGYHGGAGIAQGVSGVFVEGGTPQDADSQLLPYPRADDDLPDLWRVLDAELARSQVAAVIVEPLLSDGGLVVPPSDFLRGLAERTRRSGALLIVDEVKVGLGRTGMLHAFQHGGAVPDIVTFGKALGGGLPLSAVVGPAAVLDEAPASTLLTTAGNAISTAAGQAVINTIVDESLEQAAAARGAQLVKLLEDVQAVTPEIFEVRGLGLSLGIELRESRGARRYEDDAFTHRVIFRMWQLGVVNYLVRGNVIEWTPPLTLSADEALRAVETLHAAILDVRRGAVTQADIAPYSGW